MKKIAIAYIIMIIIVAVLPVNGSNSVLNNNYFLEIRWDYLVHALLFVPVFPLMYYGTGTKKTLKNFLLLLSLALLLAVVSESVQFFISYRAFNINDLAANFAGVILGFILGLFL